MRLGPGRETLRRLMVKARQVPLRMVFADGASDTIQRAAVHLAEEGIAQPVLLGDEGAVRAGIARLGLDPSGLEIVDPARSPRRDAYLAEYLRCGGAAASCRRPPRSGCAARSTSAR